MTVQQRILMLKLLEQQPAHSEFMKNMGIQIALHTKKEEVSNV